MVVAVSVMLPFKVVCSLSLAIDTPPTASLIFVNLKTSSTCNAPEGNETVKVVVPAVVKGSKGKK